MPTPKEINVVHQGGATAIKGIQRTSYLTLSSFGELADPLSQNSSANKPASSIPSMFARILFFRTAFHSLVANPMDTKSVYARYVSDCLDLLEMVFNHDPSVSIVRWNKTDQLNCLVHNQILHDALQSQLDKFFPNLTDIYLFIVGVNVIGGTSSHTLVYTSPNWNNTRPVTSLVDRGTEFREFLYKLATAFAGETQLEDFVAYIDQSKLNDPDFSTVSFAGIVSPQTMANDYPAYSYQDAEKVDVPIVIDPVLNLPLFSKNMAAGFYSDFYIDSSLQKFDVINTPLFITQGTHPGMSYYDNVKTTDIRFAPTEIEDDGLNLRLLPQCPYQHKYLSPICFLETKMMGVPYQIDDTKFQSVISIEIEGKPNSCFLPLKPLFFNYFKVDDLEKMITIKADDRKKEVTVALRIPVRNNDGTISNTLNVVNKYSYTDIIYIDGLDKAFNIGIFPFYQNSGIYHIMRQDKRDSSAEELKFYKVNERDAVRNCQETIRNDDNASRSTYYILNQDFDYISVSWHDNNNVQGIIIPKFEEVGNGNEQYYYGIDFGTTNTHIAYTTGGADKVASSFKTDELRCQAVFLSADGQSGDDGSMAKTRAQEFIPCDGRNDYSFPIRTVVSFKGSLNANSRMFDNVSIGFYFDKEPTTNSIYDKNLKWNFDAATPSDHVTSCVKTFCLELMWIIKNHWKLQGDADHSQNKLPRIMLTFPLTMVNTCNLLNCWKGAYENVFQRPINEEFNPIKFMTESLAPCQKIMSGGATPAGGILNIDMGGGSTDIQYYNGADAFYNSILFAGDDLWGKCYEHVVENNGIGAGIVDNKFTSFANEKLGQVQIVIGLTPKDIRGITFKDPKDKINCLLKDSGRNFINLLSTANSNTCRKIMYLHYAAIMWHVSKWMIANDITGIPGNISFSGLASNYLKMLFSSTDKLTRFTAKLIYLFTGKDVNNISLKLEPSPKNVTAEGAAMYAKADNIPTSNLSYHLGYDEYHRGDSLSYRVACSDEQKEKVIVSLSNFLDAFNSIGDCDGYLIPAEVIVLTNNEKNNLLSDARASLNQMAQWKQNKQGNVCESMFFWALKDSLWKLRN